MLEGICYHKQEAIYFIIGIVKPYAILLKAVKIGEKIFGELLVICQICQSFLLPMFFTIQY